MRGHFVARCLRAGAHKQKNQLARNFAVTAQAAPVDNYQSELLAARPYEEIPGPKKIPLLGNKYLFLPGFKKYNINNFMELQKQLYDEYGPILKIDGINPQPDLVMVFNPKDAETVYRNEGIWPERRGLRSMLYYRKELRKDFFKGVGGVLIDQGKEWQEARHQVNPILMQTKIVQMYTPKIDQVATEFVSKIPDWLDEKKELPDDFKNELHKWALESVALIALDTRLGCLNKDLSPDSEPQKLINAVHTLFEAMHNLEIGNESFIWPFISTPSWRKFVKATDFFLEVSNKYVQNAMEKLKSRPDNTEPSALEKLLKRDPNPTRAVIMALDMLFAGIDTTSHSTTNLLLHLSENQDKQEKLYQELKAIIPNPDGPITSNMLNEMKYLKACIKESMRIMPVATSNLRNLEKDIVLSNYRIPAGVDIMMGMGHMSQLEEYYKKPEKFIPERWIRGGELEEKANPFVTMPFGHGARKCIGMRFAMMEMELLLSRLLRNYRWEFKYGPMTYRSTLIHQPVDPLKFTLHKR